MMQWLFILTLLFSGAVLSADIEYQHEFSYPACSSELGDQGQWWLDGNDAADDIGLSRTPLNQPLVAYQTPYLFAAPAAPFHRRLTSPIRAPPVVLQF